MLMQAQPVFDCCEAVQKSIESAGRKRSRVIFVTPGGYTFNQKMAEDFSKEEDLIFLCGHYEGIDERVLEEIVTDYVSIGDYVLTGGELPSMVIIDGILRLLDEGISSDSLKEESYTDGLLEYPQYTRPVEYNGDKVPDVLQNGNHKEIRRYNLKMSLKETLENRPDLLERRQLSEEEKELLGEIISELQGTH